MFRVILRTSDAPDRAARRYATFQLWMLNVIAGCCIGSLWLAHLPEQLSLGARLYLPVALISSVATLAIIPGLCFVAAHCFIKSPRIAGWVCAFIGAFSLCLLYTDTIIYRLLRYHFNGAVLNVLKTSGSEDSVHLGFRVWGLVVLIISLITVLQYHLWRRSLAGATQRVESGRTPHRFLRPRALCMLVILPLIFLEKGVYAAADLTRDHEVMNACKALPNYPRVRLGRYLAEEGAVPPELEILPDSVTLDYPKSAPRIDPEGQRPNIFILVIDSWRRDMLDPQTSPKLCEFAEQARVFDNHISSGNGTRFGVFSMLYGLHGSYWFPVLEERKSPVLIDTVQALGYDVRVLSSASMNFPEFLDTAWVDVPRDAVMDEHGTDISSDADLQVAAKFDGWIRHRAEQGATRPFFCFVLLDAPHQPYYNPGGPFQPAAEDLDYIQLATEQGPELQESLFNRYRNSVLFADGVAAGMLDSLKRYRQFDNTVVIVTGDHGEEFQENGFWGHTSNFSPEQLEVPFIMSGPGIQIGRESLPTSHLDIPSTLMEMLGTFPEDRALYSLGESLFEPIVDRARVVSGYAHVGLWSKSGIFCIPFDPAQGELEVYDLDWVLQTDIERRVNAELPVIKRLAEECVRFLAVRE